MGEDDYSWAATEETLSLMDIPGMTESLLAGKAEGVDECVDADALEW